jgi:hypothetical protein
MSATSANVLWVSKLMKSMLCLVMLAVLYIVDTYIMTLVYKTNPRLEASTSWRAIVSSYTRRVR